MAWYSILPSELTHLESWAARIFFFLGLITIGPWAFLVFLDATIWIYRLILWEVPWIGGRARGRQRPRAPSLNERPGGQRRAFGLRGVEMDTGDSEAADRDDSPWSKRERDRDDPGKENEVISLSNNTPTILSQSANPAGPSRPGESIRKHRRTVQPVKVERDKPKHKVSSATSLSRAEIMRRK
ncbi:unnamed protein product [Penicillium crustosum]